MKLKKTIGLNQDVINYIYRLLSADNVDVAFKILKAMAKSFDPKYGESIGHIVLEMVKRLKHKPNGSQEIERILEVNISNQN